jgi:hypothetical protein
VPQFLKFRILAWGWLPFVVLDWTIKWAMARAVGYSSGVAIVGATFSTPLAAAIGLALYQPFRRMNAFSYGVAYFASIVAMKMLLAATSGVNEWRGGVQLVEHGRWTFAGAQEKILTAGIEALLSMAALIALQAVFASFARR